MRAKGGNPTLGELVGGKQDMSLDNLPDILGEKMPNLPKNSVGRYRLMKSLQQRFGNGYRNIPGVRDIIKQFDSDIEYDQLISKMKAIKPTRSDNG